MIQALLWCLVAAEPFIVDGRDLTAYTPEQLHLLSDEYWHAGDYKTVVTLLDRAIALDPHDVEAYSICAWLVWSGRDDPADPNYMGTEADARRYMERCLQANPDDADAVMEMGVYLFERVGDAAGAVPWLRRAARLGFSYRHATGELAQALYFSEQYSEAAATWQTMLERGVIDQTLCSINRTKNLERAGQPDALLRSGGVTDGPADAVAAARLLRDLRFDDNQDKRIDRRTIWLDLPEDPDGEPDIQILYTGRESIYRYHWFWQEIAWDANDDGQFVDETMLRDSDRDGVADGVSLAELQRRRRELPTALLRQALGADVYRIAADAEGQAVPIEPTVEGDALLFAPVISILSERQPIELRLLVAPRAAGIRQIVATTTLPAGEYATNQGAGPPCRLALRVSPELAAGRYFVFLELWVGGLKVTEWTTADHIAELAAGKAAWQTPTREDISPTPPPLVPGARPPDRPPVPGPPGAGQPVPQPG